uniref:Rad50/SbcC-type AAA domain-containing protein n=1 Tax=Timema genevievae TaxID=629358 RepID=A0A7R9JP37_TIMGE|nr:unnamed protein product [Timema genevievae]
MHGEVRKKRDCLTTSTLRVEGRLSTSLEDAGTETMNPLQKRKSSSPNDWEAKRKRSVQNSDSDYDSGVESQAYHTQSIREPESRVLSTSQQLSCSQRIKSRAGTIEKVFMRNFMCHDSLEVDLNKNVNFIIGRNGSGKSAILTAVVVALGGKANSTNRATSVKELIKIGENTGTIEVVLSNQGQRPYKPDLYGKHIIISRTISLSGSAGYKVKSSRGEIISTKREEVDKIVTAFMIQVDNPICILNQDTSRNFLNSSDPKDKFKLFMRATTLDEVKRLYQCTSESSDRASSTIKFRDEALEDTKNEMQELETQVNKLRKLKNVKKKLTTLQNELYWVIAINCEKELNSKEKAITDTKDLLEEQNRKLRSISKEIVNLEEDKRNQTTQLATLKNEAKLHEAQLSQLRTDWQQKKDILNAKKKDLHLADEKVVRQERSVANMKEHLQNLVNRQDDKCISEISAQKRQSNSNLSVFGDWVAPVLKKIDESHCAGRFTKKPIGPIGLYMKPKDISWVPAMENFFKLGLLRSFCCDNFKDSKELDKIFNSIVPRHMKPGCFVSKYFSKVHDVRKNAVVHNKYSTMLNALIITHPVVANCLIDQYELERILLIPSDTEAHDLLSKQNNVPRNCRRAITKDGNEYFPAPSYRSYGGKVTPRPKYLQVSAEDIVSNLEEQSKHERQNIALLESELIKMKEEKAQKDKVINELVVEFSRLKNQIDFVSQNLTQVKDELNQISAVSTDAITEEITHATQHLTELVEVKNALQHECDTIKTYVDEAFQKYKEVETSRNSETTRTVLDEIVSIDDKLSTANSKKTKLEHKKQELEKTLRSLETEFDRQREETNQAFNQASKLHERIDSDREPELIQDEIKNCQAFIGNVESRVGKLDQVLAHYMEKKASYERAQEKLHKLQNALMMLNKTMVIRNKWYSLIEKHWAHQLEVAFASLMGNRGFEGVITIDFERETLTMKVAPGNKQAVQATESLSGGERSFSTVSFIMALWNIVQPPFYFLDEFDVFMVGLVGDCWCDGERDCAIMGRAHSSLFSSLIIRDSWSLSLLVPGVTRFPSILASCIGKDVEKCKHVQIFSKALLHLSHGLKSKDISNVVEMSLPCVPIVLHRRSYESIEDIGVNELVEWRPDSSMLVVATSGGHLLLYNLGVQTDQKGLYEQVDSTHANLRRDSAELFIKEVIPSLHLALEKEVGVEGGITSMVCIRDELMLATTRGHILRYRWDGSENRDYCLDLRRVPFCIDQQVSKAIPIVEANTYVVDIEYSPLVGGFAIVLNDGRAAFLTASSLRFDPNGREGWLDHYRSSFLRGFLTRGVRLKARGVHDRGDSEALGKLRGGLSGD